MIQNSPVQQPVNYQQPPVAPQQSRPSYGPSYNAVQINVDSPYVDAPDPGYYYNYPQAQQQPYYQPVQQPYYQPVPQQPYYQPVPQQPYYQPVQQQPVQPQPVQPQPVNVPPPVVETQPAPSPAPQAPVDKSVDIASVVANLADPDFEKQANQMEEIAKKGLVNESDVVPYVQNDVFQKLIDIVNVDSTKLPGPTERQLQLRGQLAENNAVLAEAQQSGKDLNSVRLPHNLSPEDVELASTITPIEQAERNKEYALFTTAILQKTYADEIEKRSGTGKVVELNELPAAAMVVDTLKENINPAIRVAAIDALRYIQRPEYAQTLGQIYSIAQTDADPSVATAATDALNSLNAPQQK